MKRIVSLWLPSWPVTRLSRAEQRAVPADIPFALVEGGAHGIVITAVNERAAREGIAVGTSLSDARAAWPQLRVRQSEPEKDRGALLKLMRWAGRYGPHRNNDGADSFWIDVTGVAHLYGGEDAMLADLARRLASFGVPARIGLAGTLGAAHALARYATTARHAWACTADGQVQAALARLPVEALRIDAAAALLLKRLGLYRIGQIYDIPRESLARRFRSKDEAGAVLKRLDQALGQAAEPLRSLFFPRPFAVRRSFAEPLISAEAIESVTAALCDELAGVLAARALGVRTLALALYRADGTVAGARAGLAVPCREGAHMMSLLKDKLANIDAGFGIDMLVLEAVRTGQRDSSQSAFADKGAGASGGDPAQLIDRLSARLGSQAITVLTSRASHIPERADIRVAALTSPPPSWGGVRGGGTPGKSGGGTPGKSGGETLRGSQEPQRKRPPLTPTPLSAGTGRGGAATRYVPPWPYGTGPRRPPFLLARPEPISVIAQVPDGPPARFTWRRIERRVARAQGPERIAPEWWRAIGLSEESKRRRPRDYFEIEDETGAAYWVFRHGLYGGEGDDAREDDAPPCWFLHGLFA